MTMNDPTEATTMEFERPVCVCHQGSVCTEGCKRGLHHDGCASERVERHESAWWCCSADYPNHAADCKRLAELRSKHAADISDNPTLEEAEAYLRAHDFIDPKDVSNAFIERLLRDRLRFETALKDANDLCRSAYQIAEREGAETNWTAFHTQLKASLERQHKALHAPAEPPCDIYGTEGNKGCRVHRYVPCPTLDAEGLRIVATDPATPPVESQPAPQKDEQLPPCAWCGKPPFVSATPDAVCCRNNRCPVESHGWMSMEAWLRRGAPATPSVEPLTHLALEQFRSTIHFLMSQVETLASRAFSEGQQEWLEHCDAYNAGRRAIQLADKIKQSMSTKENQP